MGNVSTSERERMGILRPMQTVTCEHGIDLDRGCRRCWPTKLEVVFDELEIEYACLLEHRHPWLRLRGAVSRFLERLAIWIEP
jgi:hypothetical protein